MDDIRQDYDVSHEIMLYGERREQVKENAKRRTQMET